MTEYDTNNNNNNKNEKKQRMNLRQYKYAQFLVTLGFLLFLSLSNSQQATKVSKQQSSISAQMAQAEEEGGFTSWQAYVDEVRDESDSADGSSNAATSEPNQKDDHHPSPKPIITDEVSGANDVKHDIDDAHNEETSRDDASELTLEPEEEEEDDHHPSQPNTVDEASVGANLSSDGTDDVHNDTSRDAAVATLEPKQDLPLEESTELPNATRSRNNTKKVINSTTLEPQRDLIVVNEEAGTSDERPEATQVPNNTNKNTTSVTTTIILPKEPREYYEKLPPCQIRVANRRQAHFEVVESTAKLIPYEYLNLTQKCNHYHLNFEFDTKEIGWPARAKIWAKDMNERLKGTFIIDNATGIKRSFGPAVIGILRTRPKWDQVIQVSCSCDEKDKRWLQTMQFAPRMCIGHGWCNWSLAFPNYIQVSPHYERYFVPSALPHYDDSPFEKDDRFDICTIGSTRRRKWKLLIPFLENETNQKKWLDKIRIRILGKGGIPKQLKNYTNFTEIIPNQIPDDRKFYAAVKACGIIMLPIGKDEDKGYKHYFKSVNGSKWKLSGTIPPIIAYERPFVVPNELLELYHKELPLHVPHRGFEDDDLAFAEALSSLLEELLKQ